MEKVKLFLKGILYILLYFIITIFIYSLFYTHIYGDNLILANLATILSDLIVLFIFIVVFRKTIVPDFHYFKNNFKMYIKNNYHYWLIGLAIMVITNTIIGLFIANLPTNEELNREILLSVPLSSIFAMVIAGPINEELLTRIIFKKTIKKEYLYIFISGFVFGSLHMLSATSLIELLYVIPYTALGCAFAKMYYKTDNIWPNIFFHSIHNLIAIILIFVGV